MRGTTPRTSQVRTWWGTWPFCPQWGGWARAKLQPILVQVQVLQTHHHHH